MERKQGKLAYSPIGFETKAELQEYWENKKEPLSRRIEVVDSLG
ncbi:hypothetical protein [Paenibacillus caseinilyticus]|nr:hypothetical protein [Paenibacillus caseinilyticus]MCZ8523976.1 hypothetical protein [Paenibacillus caseinilyticus]